MLNGDQTAIATLCKLLKHDLSESVTSVILGNLFYIGWNGYLDDVKTDNDSNPMFTGCMMENGAIETILHLLHIIVDTKDIYRAVALLVRFIDTDFKNTRFFERSTKWKGGIFAELPMLLKTAENMDNDYEQRVYKKVFDVFQYYLIQERNSTTPMAMVRCHIKNGTITKLFKLFGQMSNDNTFVKAYLNDMIHTFHIILVYTETKEQMHGLNTEFRILTEVAVKNLSQVSKDNWTFENVMKNISTYLNGGDRGDREFYVREKLFKRLILYLVVELGSTEMRHEKLNCLLDTLMIMYTILKSSIVYKDFRAINQSLPALLDFQKHSVDFLEKGTCLIALLFGDSIAFDKDGMALSDLRAPGQIALLVQNVKILHSHSVDEQIKYLAWSPVCQYFGTEENSEHRVTLTNIDEMIPGIPLCIDLISQTEVNTDCIKIYRIIGVLSVIVTKLVSVNNDGLGQIDSQLHALEECDFVCGIGRALTLTKEPIITSQLLGILIDLSQLIDRRVLMEKLLDFLPDLAEKQKKYNDHTNDEGRLLWSQISDIMRKAAAYALDDIDPVFFVKDVSPNIVIAWKSFRILGKKMLFLPHSLETEENSTGLCTHIDVLRATWKMTEKFPELISSEIAKSNLSVFGENTHPQRTLSGMPTLIIKTLISYLDHSQENSLDFLKELTSFIKDLSHEAVSSEMSRVMFSGLPQACEDFLKVNSDKVTSHNLKYFINVYYASLD